ncbi:MAG: histidine phosphatase family protein [Saprospiraceae bacterium]|nr:histidine phosphatase family protein [Saprospiraceae bacterium]
MRSLYLIRHAKSSWEHPGLRDFERPLNNRGLRDAPLMAALMKNLGVVPDLLISSPARRAWSTACIFAEAYGLPFSDIQQAPDLYECRPQDVLKVVSGLPEAARVVLLFGHNPALTEFANRFTDDPIDNIPTCGVVRIDSVAPDWASFYDENARVAQTWFPKTAI